jgi:hypothetical protein
METLRDEFLFFNRFEETVIVQDDAPDGETGASVAWGWQWRELGLCVVVG